MGRWIRFLIAIIIGLAAGLYYAWVVNPVTLIDTTPGTLRSDYKTDYVLMTAEVYQTQQNIALAARSLALLGDESPSTTVHTAINFAEEAGFSQTDISLMSNLLQGLQNWNPIEGSEP